MGRKQFPSMDGDAREVSTKTSDFNDGLTSTEDTVQKALARINDEGSFADTAKEFTEQQNFNETALSISTGAIAWNLATNQVARVTLTENATVSAPSNMKQGGTYILSVTQDGTGGRTLAYNAAFKWPGGTAPTLSVTAAAIDILVFKCDGTYMYGSYEQDFS